eukprot:8194190-Pyramimonas_sp.AAC.1
MCSVDESQLKRSSKDAKRLTPTPPPPPAKVARPPATMPPPRELMEKHLNDFVANAAVESSM